MDTERTLLEALHADPGDETARLALADRLEEQGRGGQAELVRLHQALRLRGRRGRRVRSSPGCAGYARRRGAAGGAGAGQLGGDAVRPDPGGGVLDGLAAGRKGRFADEGPVHRVELTWPFYLGVFPVTQAEYRVVTGTAPSHFCPGGGGREQVEGLDTDRFPVEMVNWDLGHLFCLRLSELPQERRAGRRYRLPTEAEWEYACRAGLSFAGPFHQGATLSSRQANFNGREEPYGGAAEGPWLERTCPVDAYPPNAFGLYDLHGNVSEWCADWFAAHYYEESPEADPPGPATGDRRVLRGGSWNDYGRHCRAALRYDRPPEEERTDFGFRVVMEPGAVTGRSPLRRLAGVAMMTATA
ncbi:MAG: SUMF1/EgtB/PvdO family nonheme iron enzyme [Gemmataceae bacterium]